MTAEMLPERKKKNNDKQTKSNGRSVLRVPRVFYFFVFVVVETFISDIYIENSKNQKLLRRNISQLSRPPEITLSENQIQYNVTIIYGKQQKLFDNGWNNILSRTQREPEIVIMPTAALGESEPESF